MGRRANATTGRRGALVAPPTWARHASADLTTLAAQWVRMGAALSVPASRAVVDLEALIISTADVAPDDERVFVVAATWLGQYHAFVNGRRLAALAAALSSTPALAGGDVTPTDARCRAETSAVLGALLWFADHLAGHGEPFAAVRARCRPLAPGMPLFRVVRAMPSMAADAESRALPGFAQWGVWHDDVTPKREAIRPIPWLLSHVPELQIRAVVGPLLEADVLTAVLVGGPGERRPEPEGVTVRDVARAYQVSYAAAHASAEQLVLRGLLVRERDGVRQVLRASRWACALVG